LLVAAVWSKKLILKLYRIKKLKAANAHQVSGVME
jgi:hypothetical protein